MGDDDPFAALTVLGEDLTDEFLNELAGEDDLLTLQQQYEMWATTGDLNEIFIAGCRVRARKLLMLRFLR